MRAIATAVFIMLLPVMVRSQITITAADMPNVGDTLRYSEATQASAMGYNFAQTGTNFNWDYSNLTHSGQDVDTFVSVLSTPIFYYPSFLGNATIAKKGDQLSAGTFSLTNVYDYFKEATSYYSQVGFAASLNGVPLPTPYSSPDYLYRFPLTYMNQDSCTFGYAISIPTLFSYHNQSKRVNRVDGWGTLTTPFGTFQALRVRSEVTSRDSITLDTLPFPIPPTTTQYTEYKWLANGYHMPLLLVTNRGMTSTVVYMDHYKSTSGTGNPDRTALPGLQLFPNPTYETVILSHENLRHTQQSVQVMLHDLWGRRVMEQEVHPSDGQVKLDLQALPAGIWHVTVHQAGMQVLHGKVIKI